MKEFTTEGKTITTYPSAAADRAVIYFNTFSDEGKQVYDILREQKCPDFTLITICGLNWEHDLSPWKAPSIFSGQSDFKGEADSFLALLTRKIIPQAEAETVGEIPWRGIAGYSLAGLFAIYSLFRTDMFSRAASMSGSLWFPHFKEYVQSSELQCLPECMYFSLGNKECKTRNPYLKTVQSSTEEIAAFFESKNINTVFQLNPGSHYTDTAARSAAGILWILEKQEEYL